MAPRRIVWTATAKNQLIEILEFYNLRNKSKSYSRKLNIKLQNELNLLILQPNIGKKTNQLNIRELLVEDYFVFYEVKENHIIVLSVWNTKQNPDRLKL